MTLRISINAWQSGGGSSQQIFSNNHCPVVDFLDSKLLDPSISPDDCSLSFSTHFVPAETCSADSFGDALNSELLGFEMSGRVLVVDDTPTNLFVLSKLLTRKGYIVDQADNGIDAIALARTHRPTVILLDFMMHQIDGLEV